MLFHSMPVCLIRRAKLILRGSVAVPIQVAVKLLVCVDLAGVVVVAQLALAGGGVVQHARKVRGAGFGEVAARVLPAGAGLEPATSGS
jgi:hypothetical protein